MSRGPAAPRSPFDRLVDDYAAARPHYPPELFDWLPDLAGRRLLELGAGTGIATRELAARGARVLAADIGAGMLARLQAELPAVPCVVAAAEHLPLPDSSVSLVCAAQAWHWVAQPAGTLEAARVLEPGGTLALWWNNLVVRGEPWLEWQFEWLEAHSGWRRGYRERDYAGELTASGAFTGVGHRTVRWSRELDFDRYEQWLCSKSYVDALGPLRAEFLAGARAELNAAFPQAIVTEPFRTDLWLARRRPNTGH